MLSNPTHFPFQFSYPATLDLSIILVSFNTRDILHKCLDSLNQNLSGLSHETWVVDNHSTDGSSQMIKESFPEVQLIENKENRGFAAANNQALANTRGRYIVLLNSDTYQTQNSFLEIVHYLDTHPEFSILSPRIIAPDGTPYPMRFLEDTAREAFLKIFGWSDSSKDPACKEPPEPGEVQAVGGPCMVFRRELAEKIGLLDENHFLYNEEDDFCRRARDKGGKICYYPATSIVHLHGKSTHQPQVREMVILEAYKSDLYFFSKYYSKPWNIILRAFYRIAFMAGIFRAIFRRLAGHPPVPGTDSISLKLKLLLTKHP